MSSYAVLVDGGFLRMRLGSEQQPLSAQKVHDFLDALATHDALAGHRLHRVYFYDAAPIQETKQKPLNGGAIDFAATPMAAQNRALHSALIRLPFIAMRMGEVAFRGWGLRPGVLPPRAPNVTIDSNAVETSHPAEGRGHAYRT